MQESLNECVAQLSDGLEAFPWDHARAYGDWLAQTYYYVRHSTRLLAASAARFSCDERGNMFHHRFGAHLAEEKKHELLALHDIKSVGFDLASFSEHHVTRMFYEPQYYKVEHLNPIVLLGYILALEAMSASKGKWVLDRVTAGHGDNCAAFLKVHAEDDVEHVQKALRVLEGVSAEESALIERNLRQSTFGYLAMLQESRRQADRSGAQRSR
jgi:hypothetical protein